MSGLPDFPIVPGDDCTICTSVNTVTPAAFEITFYGVENTDPDAADYNGTYLVPQTVSLPCLYELIELPTFLVISYVYGSSQSVNPVSTIDFGIGSAGTIFRGVASSNCVRDGVYSNIWTADAPSPFGYYGGQAVVEPFRDDNSPGPYLIQNDGIADAENARWNRAGVPADGPPGATTRAIPPDSYQGAASINSDVRVDLVVSRRDKTRINIKYDTTE